MKYYSRDYPKLDDVVQGRVLKITVSHVVVELEEYDGLEAMILVSDVYVRRKRKKYCLINPGKSYPFVVKEITENDGKTNFMLSYKYVQKERKDDFDDYFRKYKRIINTLKTYTKRLRSKVISDFCESHKSSIKGKAIFKYINDFFQGKNDLEEFEATESEKQQLKEELVKHDVNDALFKETIWLVKPEELYNYIISFYKNENNLEIFNMTEEQKILYKDTLTKIFGKLKIITTLNFELKNLNHTGIEDITSVFDQVNDKYQVEVMINTVPQYFISITSDNESENTALATDIEEMINTSAQAKNCLFTKGEIVTTCNL